MNYTPETVRRYVDGRNDLVHAAYLYECRSCGELERIYLGVGVEGPDRSGSWIASPFMGPRCRCGGETSHVAWSADLHFPNPVPAPPGARYFAVPDAGPDPDAFGSSCFAGEMRRAPERRIESEQ